MASRALRIVRRNPNRNPNPSFIHRFFSSSSTSDDADDSTPPPPPPPPPPPSSSSSIFDFKDVSDSLKQPPQPPRKPSLFSSSSSSSSSTPVSFSAGSFAEIQKNLSGFRHRSSDPNPSKSSSSSASSFRDLYQRNVVSKPEASPRGKASFDSIRKSLKKLGPVLNPNEAGQNKGKKDLMSLSAFKDSLKLRPVESSADQSSVVIGGSDNALRMSLSGKDMREGKEAESTEKKMGFLRPYGVRELGEKLRDLRPEVRGEKWFSLTELNERLMKIIEMDEKAEKDMKIGGVSFENLRSLLSDLSEEDSKKPSAGQRMNFLSNFGLTPSIMQGPSKEHLVEQYFHPDNMTSAEKMKLELKKVRDEFKMSESDCGSARVQVAQLTTKIKHLSSVLHKKDKHSRKGLHEMVQMRKKLLKYLRRTDWDSYCLVLSKLGLRDNPTYKSKI